jgi:hypothetical protein
MGQIDWSQLQALAESEKFELIPEGKYVFIVESGEIKETAKKNGVMLNLKCKIVEGPLAGRVQFGGIYIPTPGGDHKPGVFSMMNGKLNAIGLTLAELVQHNPTDAQVSALVKGKTFIGEVKHRSWNGTMRDGIDGYASINGAPATLPAAAAPGATTLPAAPTSPFA